MFDFDNDQLGIFDEDLTALYEEDLGFEQQDETLSALAVLFDDELTELAEIVEQSNIDMVREAYEKLYGYFSAVCEDEFDVSDPAIMFELLLTDYDLPATFEVFDD